MHITKDNRGSTALEFSLVVPIWLGFVIGVMQIGLLLWVENMMHDVVDAAARCMAVHTTCTDQTSMQNYAMMITVFKPGFLWQASDFHLNDSTAGTCSGGSQVSISYSYKLLYVHPLTISAKSCYPNWS
jgi:Flp pilus assembly protein TadG